MAHAAHNAKNAGQYALPAAFAVLSPVPGYPAHNDLTVAAGASGAGLRGETRGRVTGRMGDALAQGEGVPVPAQLLASGGRGRWRPAHEIGAGALLRAHAMSVYNIPPRVNL